MGPKHATGRCVRVLYSKFCLCLVMTNVATAFSLAAAAASQSHTCTAADVLQGFANVTHMCDNLLFPYVSRAAVAVQYVLPR